eukprot:TRINITY_DN4365_c0_g1_i1.p1 TRINITY_DN4365_c0_g1~~TRINITY_DN4365_c0_g1_i1.p1  ORF type:complete len:512 (+),score=76.09 TRINITY_DN4365_c0_g1_i1:163-1698(+)
MHMQRQMSNEELFRRRSGFLGILGIALTCGVYLMTLLRPVLEPFLWAVFLVAALQPLVTWFETLLLSTGRLICGFAGHVRRRRRFRKAERAARSMCGLSKGRPERRSKQLRAPIISPPELSSVPDSAVDSGLSDNDNWRIASLGRTEDGGVDICAGCFTIFARVAAVAFAIGFVLAILVGVILMVLDAAYKIKDNFPIYETGAQNAIEEMNELCEQVFGTVPPQIVDLLWDNVIDGAKSMVSNTLSGLLSHMGKFLFEFLMLLLYVMFWLCTPMPMNTVTSTIFRRYLLLKGAVCVCYGACVWALLYMLSVDIAFFFGLLSIFLNLIPEVGPFVAMVLPIPVIVFDSRLEAPFITLLFALLGQLALKFVFANIVEVMLIENDHTMRMHPVVTLLAIAFFGFIWGPTGMLLCVPLMSYMKVVILSDLVPPAYRDPILVVIEGDGQAPERHRRRMAEEREAEAAAFSESSTSRARESIPRIAIRSVEAVSSNTTFSSPRGSSPEEQRSRVAPP